MIIMKIIRRVFQVAGYDLVKMGREKSIPNYMDRDFVNIVDKINDFSMTDIMSKYYLYKSIEYIANSNIEGSFVECGVWKGGSSML